MKLGLGAGDWYQGLGIDTVDQGLELGFGDWYWVLGNDTEDW